MESLAFLVGISASALRKCFRPKARSGRRPRRPPAGRRSARLRRGISAARPASLIGRLGAVALWPLSPSGAASNCSALQENCLSNSQQTNVHAQALQDSFESKLAWGLLSLPVRSRRRSPASRDSDSVCPRIQLFYKWFERPFPLNEPRLFLKAPVRQQQKCTAVQASAGLDASSNLNFRNGSGADSE